MSDNERTGNASAKYWLKLLIPFTPWRLSFSTIYAYLDDLGKVPYMRRIILEHMKEGRRSYRLHWILQADGDDCLHDHPWWFKSRILLGRGYVEVFQTQYGQMGRYVKPGEWHSRPLGFKHRISNIIGKSCLTFVIAGPLEHEWGFHTTHGFEGWEKFTGTPKSQRVGWCDHER